MGKSTKDGRWKSGSMPTVRIDRKNKQARVFIGGKQHHLGRVEGDKISPAQAAEAARIWYQFLNGTLEVVASPNLINTLPFPLPPIPRCGLSLPLVC